MKLEPTSVTEWKAVYARIEARGLHVAERAAQGIVPKPLNAEWTAQLVDLLKNPPAGEEDFLVELITNRVPPGVDEAAYVNGIVLPVDGGYLTTAI